MIKLSKSIDVISEEDAFCPVCGSVNISTLWNETVYLDGGVEVETENSYYHCNKCGYFLRNSDCDNYDEYEPDIEFGISIMKNPFKAVRQILVLRKYCKCVEQYKLSDHTQYEPNKE